MAWRYIYFAKWISSYLSVYCKSEFLTHATGEFQRALRKKLLFHSRQHTYLIVRDGEEKQVLALVELPETRSVLSDHVLIFESEVSE